MGTLLTRDVDDIHVVYIIDVRLVDTSRIESLAAELNRQVQECLTDKLILNLQNVAFMSSTMIGKLIQFGKKCKSAKVKLRICGANKDLSEVFRVMALQDEFAIFPDEPAALADFK